MYHSGVSHVLVMCQSCYLSLNPDSTKIEKVCPFLHIEFVVSISAINLVGLTTNQVKKPSHKARFEHELIVLCQNGQLYCL